MSMAALPGGVLDAALVSPGRFFTTDLPIAAPDRELLLTAFGMVGIRTAISLIRSGARDVPALAAELVGHSGLDQLRDTLQTRFGSRNRQLKAHSALRTLRRILLRHRSPNTVRTFRSVDRLLADTHCFTELRVLAGAGGLASTRTNPQRPGSGTRWPRHFNNNPARPAPRCYPHAHPGGGVARHPVLARSAQRTTAGPTHHPDLPRCYPQL
jgi:hypothetical protein